MTKQNTCLGIEQHERLGAEISEVARILFSVQKELDKAYGDKCHRLTQDAIRSVDKIRKYLDARLFLEYPEASGNSMAAIHFSRAYTKCGNDEK